MKYPSIGPFILDWMTRNLVHAEGDLYGEPFQPPGWLKQAVNRTYRFDPETMTRMTSRVLVGLPKGCAKTEGAAAWGAAEFAGPVVPWPGVLSGEWPRPRHSPNVPIGAASYGQAKLCFGAVGIMVREGPLAPFADVYEQQITFKDQRPGRIYRIAAEAGTNDGTLPTAFIADEVHEWTGRKARVHTVVGNSLRKRKGGLEIDISTAGDPDTSELLMALYEYARKVETGEVDDPGFYSIWMEASREWDLSDHSQLVAATAEAYVHAPWLDPAEIAKRYYEVKEHEYRRYHLNQWVTGGTSWLPAGAWDLCAVKGRDVPKGTEVVLAFDGSHNGDSTALFGCTLDGHVFEVGVWERPENAREWRVPRNEVDAAVEKAFRRYRVRELACDPARWVMYLDEWVERYGDDVVIEFPQTRAYMAPATSKFYDAVVNQLVTHDGSAALTRHITQAAIREFPGGYMLAKDHPNRKIDCAVTAVMAYDRATARAEETTEPRVTFI